MLRLINIIFHVHSAGIVGASDGGRGGNRSAVVFDWFVPPKSHVPPKSVENDDNSILCFDTT